jgi:hypothetical protein
MFILSFTAGNEEALQLDDTAEKTIRTSANLGTE